MFVRTLLLTLTTLVFGQFYPLPYRETVGPEDAYLSIYQLAAKYGYPLETHTVITEDKYILKIHRIPYGRRKRTNGITVFLMHGIWECSDSWLLLGPKRSLAYILADEGYDVWLGNARGNRHTFDHISLAANTSRFWEFSWEEIGIYDLPAMIDHTLYMTGQKTLYYIGYSQGTTSFFVMTSMRSEYNAKIKRMFALAPGAFMSNTTSPILKLFAPIVSYLPISTWNVNTADALNEFNQIVCVISPSNCGNFYRTAIGPNNVSESMWPIVLGHIPTGSSLFQFLHYGQLITSRRFCRYNFGRKKNIERYGKPTPPDYELANIVAPVILFYSNRDSFSNMRDVSLLRSRLPNVKRGYFVKDFTHIDYMYAEMSKLVYMKIINNIQQTNLNSN